jgi:hypothetical protein
MQLRVRKLGRQLLLEGRLVIAHKGLAQLQLVIFQELQVKHLLQ